MKRWIYIIIVILVNSIVCYSQENSSKYQGRPMPDWVMGATPEPHHDSYYYKVFEAENADREVARNQAIKQAFQQAMTFISVGVKTDEVFAALDRENNLNVISETFSIPIYFTCEFSKKTPDGTKWIYWILCQIAVRGNVVPQFDTHYTDCNVHEIWDKQKEQESKDLIKEKKKVDATALATSFFIPGSGQMIKRRYTEGSLTLLGELALVGGGVGTYFIGKKQLDIMNDRTVEYEAFHSARKTYNTMRIISYTCYGAAAALYIFNLYRAYTVTPRPKKSYAFYPTLIQSDEYNLAMGVGMTIKF